jgi:hypothetical protein
MDLRPCHVCGSTLTGAFRFCPGCGASVDDDEPLEELAAAPPQRRERRPRRPARQARKQAAVVRFRHVAARSAAVASRSAKAASRSAGVASRGRRAGAGALAPLRAFATFCATAVGVCAEAAAASVRSTLAAVRLQILLQKLHARRAAVIYATGSAVLNEQSTGIRAAKDELRVLDELIAAALTHRTATLPPVAVAVADDAAGEADAPTQDDVRAPALSRA